MGRYNTKNVVAIKKTNDLEIIFYDFESIYVKHQYGISVYHRWAVKKKGFYKNNFRPFRLALKDNKNIDYGYINRMAEKYEIDVDGVDELPNLTGVKTRIIPSYGRARNIGVASNDIRNERNIEE